MIVSCDKCGAKFQLADSKITDKGTKVRCSKCKAIFTVHKPVEKAVAPGPVPAPPPKPAAPQAVGEKKGDDPFSDFNFSDDLDFGEQEINVKPRPEPEKGFLDSVPSAPIPGKPATTAPADDGGFDFSDEEFSISEPAAPPPKPAAPAAPPRPAAPAAPPKPAPAPPPKPAAPAKPAGKSPNADEFGDFKFDDDESFNESPAAEPAVGGGPDSEDWGNVSIGADDPGPKARAGAEEMEEPGFGDFKFDDGSGGGKDEEIGADSFRRSEKSDAPVRDDLEASIGEGDSEPEAPRPAARKAEAAEPSHSPPKPVIKMETRKSAGGSKGWLVIVILAVVFFGGIFGGVGYTNRRGWFTFSDLFSGKFKKLGDIPAANQWLIDNGYRQVPSTGAIEVVEGSVKPDQVTREDLGLTMIVITGKVANRTNKVQSAIKVGAELKNASGDIVATASSFCGVEFTDAELKSLSKEEIQSITDTSSGRDMKCMEVPTGAVLPFTIVFFDYPKEGALKVSNTRVLESRALGE